MKKRIIAILMLLVTLVTSSCTRIDMSKEGETLTDGMNLLHTAVVYNSKTSNGEALDIIDYLSQPITCMVDTILIDVSKSKLILEGYDVVFLDSSLVNSDQTVKEEIQRTVKADGTIAVVANALGEFFDTDFIGAKAFVKLDSYPEGELVFDTNEKYKEIISIISDFKFLYEQYPEFYYLANQSYGNSVDCSSALPLVGDANKALYTVNTFGLGEVFYLSNLLPNFKSIAGYSMDKRAEGQSAFASTTASANALLINAMTSYAFKNKYGYSVSKVYGAYGGNNLSWELHFEEITGIKNNAATIFSEACKKSSQMPSFSLIRSTYEWFLKSESITYLLGGSTRSHHTFDMDYEESAYSSGIHVGVGTDYLTINSMTGCDSYFVDKESENYRAYPVIEDVNNDKKLDIISGSSDGKIYYFQGNGYHDRLLVLEGSPIKDSKGKEISVDSFSAPELYDVDGDGLKDIICGSADGKIYWFKRVNKTTQKYNAQGVLIDLEIEAQVLPAVGNLLGGPADDLIIGTSVGKVFACIDSISAIPTEITSQISEVALLKNWLSPYIYDYDGDGVNDLLLGTFEGYIAIRLYKDNTFSDGGFISYNEANYKGNNNAKFGNYCSPRLLDINDDGYDDLICGQIEYGMAVPITSNFFDYETELERQIAYFKKNNIYCGVHMYTNAYASTERENYELRAQLESRTRYGLSNGMVGANQHTWYTSTGSPKQTFLSQWNNGILWNSGFMSANAASSYPQSNTQNTISLPFFLNENGDQTILIQNVSNLLYLGEDYLSLSAKYNMPMCVFYHCDFAYQDGYDASQYINPVQQFRNKYNYNFVSENQMMLETSANINATVYGVVTEGKVHLIANNQYVNEEGKTSVKLYDSRYAKAVGVKVSFSNNVDPALVTTNAKVYRWDGTDLYVSLDDNTEIRFDLPRKDETHISAINLPADITIENNKYTVEFLDGGYMEVYFEGGNFSRLFTKSDGWEKTVIGSRVRFSKYGLAETLVVEEK